MNCTCQHLLARAVLTNQENGGVCISHRASLPECLFQRLAGSDESSKAGCSGQFVAEARVFQLEPPHARRLIDNVHDLGTVEWLFKKAVGAAFYCFAGSVLRICPCDYNHLG